MKNKFKLNFLKTFFENKKAQTSIFIAIGVVLVMAGSFIVYNSDVELFSSEEDRVEGQIVESVDYCLEESLEDALFYLSFQGGVIDTQSYIRFRDDYLQFGDNSSSSFKIPNWDVEEDRFPTINSMEEELNKFVRENSIDCIENSLDTMKDYLNIEIFFEEFKVESDIELNDISISVDLPIDFSQINGDVDSTINNFYLTRESNLGDLYNLAVEIYNLEAETYFLEDLTMDQIYSASDYSNRQYSMPTEGMVFSCTPQIWLKRDLENILMNLNNNNFRYLELVGTQPIDYRFEGNLKEYSDLDDYFINQYSYEIENKENSYLDYEVEITSPQVESFTNSYSLFSPYRKFEVTPSNGQIVKSMEQKVDSGFGKFSFGCIQVYHHLYDLDYDLMVKLSDNSNDRNEFFQFPIRVVIENNEPKESTPTFIIPETQVNTLTQTTFCAEENLIYPTFVEVQDDKSGDFLNNVNISYTCLGLSCDLGQTQKKRIQLSETFEQELPTPVFEGEIPYCYGGKFKAEKKGYFMLPVSERFPGEFQDSTDITEDNPYRQVLKMVKTKEFELNSNSFEARAWSNDVNAPSCFVYSNSQNDELYLRVESKKYDFESEAFYSKGEDLGDFNKIEFLVKDNVEYNVSAYYIRDGDVIGFIEQTIVPNVESSNYLSIVVPFTDNFDGDEFVNYYENSKDLYGNFGHCQGLKSTPFGFELK